MEQEGSQVVTQWVNVVTTGVFYYRIAHSNQWFFCPLVDNEPSEKDGFPVICAFEPFLEIVQYTIEHSELSDKFKASVYTVVKAEKCQWSKRICAVIGLKLALFKPKDSFHDFLAKRLGTSNPPNPSIKCKLWMLWDRIVYIALIRQVSLMDSTELTLICSELVKGSGLNDTSSSSLSYVFADMLIPELSGFQHTLIQEMKDYMKREQKWEVPLSGLTRLPTRLAFPEKFESPITFSKGVLSFEPTDTVSLRPDEPVDFLVDRMVKWDDTIRIKDKNLYFPSAGTLTCQERKEAKRFKIDQGIESWTRIHQLMEELELGKVLFVFDSFKNPQRARYENWSGDMFRFRPMINREGERKKLVWTKRTNDQKHLYRIKNTSLSDEELWASYKSVQTIDFKQIELLEDRECDAVFFFGAKRIRKRWLQWCDTCCGKQTRLILVGDISNSF